MIFYLLPQISTPRVREQNVWQRKKVLYVMTLWFLHICWNLAFMWGDMCARGIKAEQVIISHSIWDAINI